MSDLYLRDGYLIDNTGHPVTVVRPGDTAPCFYCNTLQEARALIDFERQLDSEFPPSETQ